MEESFDPAADAESEYIIGFLVKRGDTTCYFTEGLYHETIIESMNLDMRKDGVDYVHLVVERAQGEIRLEAFVDNAPEWYDNNSIAILKNMWKTWRKVRKYVIPYINSTKKEITDTRDEYNDLGDCQLNSKLTKKKKDRVLKRRAVLRKKLFDMEIRTKTYFKEKFKGIKGYVPEKY